MSIHNTIAHSLTRFKGVVCSEIHKIPHTDITTLSLLFDKIILPNHFDIFLCGISKEVPGLSGVSVELERTDEDEIKIGYSAAETDAIEVLMNYNDFTNNLFHTYGFCLEYGELFGSIFETNLFKESMPTSKKVFKDGDRWIGEETFYPMISNQNGVHYINEAFKNGCVPLLFDQLNETSKVNKSISTIASILAAKSIKLILPETKKVDPEIILEAREKLSDHLPPFWSAMLKFSKESQEVIKSCKSFDDVIQECQNSVDATVRPALIDLNDKIIKERKIWFYKILGRIGKFASIFITKPNLTNLDLLTQFSSITSSTATDYVSNKFKIKEMQKEAGLTYLMKLGEITNRI